MVTRSRFYRVGCATGSWEAGKLGSWEAGKLGPGGVSGERSDPLTSPMVTRPQPLESEEQPVLPGGTNEA